MLPAFRRRGIGHTLVTAAITLARDKKAKTVTLDVISDNCPAVKLYEDLDFHRYSGEVQLERQPDVEPPARIPMPSNYSMLQYQLKNWRYRYVLAKRSTPSDVQQYQPITESNFRRPFLLRPLGFLVMRFGGSTRRSYLILDDKNQSPVAEAWFSARKRASGI